MRSLLALIPLLLVGCGETHVPCAASTAPLVIRQLALPGPSIGVSTVVELPDGRRLLIDVGNDSHDGVVREAAPAVDFVLVTHGDEDHAGGREDLADVLAGATEIDGLGLVELGEGVTLDVFLARGVLRTPQGDVDLRGEVPDLDSSENANSLGAVLSWGSFDWVFAGDLTGGGKGTPDVESAVAARGAELVAPGSVELVSLNHHGISSSTNAAWVDWLLPGDGAVRHALSNGNGTYLAAPHEDILDRVGPRLNGGAVWVGVPGSLTPDGHPDLRTTGGEVVVGVADGGDTYTVCGVAAEATPANR
mgnify:CR=1 FL=1